MGQGVFVFTTSGAPICQDLHFPLLPVRPLCRCCLSYSQCTEYMYVDIVSLQSACLLRLASFRQFAWCSCINNLMSMQGATVVDFAYHVHTDVGNHMQAAKVNGKPVHSDYALKNAEVRVWQICNLISLSSKQSVPRRVQDASPVVKFVTPRVAVGTAVALPVLDFDSSAVHAGQGSLG